MFSIEIKRKKNDLITAPLFYKKKLQAPWKTMKKFFEKKNVKSCNEHGESWFKGPTASKIQFKSAFDKKPLLNTNHTQGRNHGKM